MHCQDKCILYPQLPAFSRNPYVLRLLLQPTLANFAEEPRDHSDWIGLLCVCNHLTLYLSSCMPGRIMVIAGPSPPGIPKFLSLSGTPPQCRSMPYRRRGALLSPAHLPLFLESKSRAWRNKQSRYMKESRELRTQKVKNKSCASPLPLAPEEASAHTSPSPPLTYSIAQSFPPPRRWIAVI